MSLKNHIIEQLKTNRPNLSASSLKTYSSVLKNLQKNMDGNDTLQWFDNCDEEILQFLENKTPQTKKTTLSALFVLTKKQSYKDVMMEVMKTVNESNKDQKMNEKQKENWISIKEIQNIYDNLLVKIKLMLNNKKIMNEPTMMEFLLVSFLGGISNLAPRRSMDYSEMKIRNYDTKKDNYYKAGKFYFNVYKTAKDYGLQIVDAPKDLNVILKKWVKINTNDYMLYSTNGNKLTSPQITRILNKVFGKNISTSMLRHIYLTNMYKDLPAINKMQQLANNMGHSISTAMEYIKK
jgi:site-specific recombinase XerD